MNELGVEGLDLLLKDLLFFPFPEKLVRSPIQSLNNLVFILFDLLLLFLQLHQLCLVNQHLILLVELRSQLVQFVLILSDQSFLVQVFVY